MAWLTLLLAGIFEAGWAVGLKYTGGFTRLVPSLLTGASMIASFMLLSVALKTLPLGTSYAVWTGIGTIGAVIFGIVLFNESIDVVRLGCITLVIFGILGLKFTSPE